MVCDVNAAGEDTIHARVTHVFSPDTDSDGLVDATEDWLGTDPNLKDTDGDDLWDGAEVFTHTTDPLDPDTDGDDLPDGWEVAVTLDPKDGTGDNGGAGDPDLDRFLNRDEYGADTDPFDPDSLLLVIELSPSPSGATITWIGGSNATQVVESIQALTGTGLTWQAILTNLPPTPVTNATMDPGPAAPALHYRIRAKR